MTSAFLTLTKGQGHTIRLKVTDMEVSAFSECFLFGSTLTAHQILSFCLIFLILISLIENLDLRLLNQNNVYNAEDTAEKLTGGVFRKNEKV